MPVDVFSGEVNRTWRFLGTDGTPHEVSLMHDPLTGARAAMVDHEELAGSIGTSSLFHGSATVISFRCGTSIGTISIDRNRVFGFSYSCFADGKVVREASSSQAATSAGASSSSGGSTLTARVVGHCTTRDHTSVTTPITWYLVETTKAASRRREEEEEEDNPFGTAPQPPTTLVHRRFRDFADLDEAVTASLAGHHMRSSIPKLPAKKMKLFQDHKDPNFKKQRQTELDEYLRRLITSVPQVLSCPATLPFVGVAENVREYSLVFTDRTLGFTIAKCSPRKAANSSFETTSPQFPTYVAQLERGCPPGLVDVGDVVSKVSGVSTSVMAFRDVITAIKHSQRPLMLHFLALVKTTPQQQQQHQHRQQQPEEEDNAAASGPLIADV